MRKSYFCFLYLAKIAFIVPELKPKMIFLAAALSAALLLRPAGAAGADIVFAEGGLGTSEDSYLSYGSVARGGFGGFEKQRKAEVKPVEQGRVKLAGEKAEVKVTFPEVHPKISYGELLPGTEKLQSRIDAEFLSGPFCAGRASGSAGFVEAQSYVQRRLEGIAGLQGIRTLSFPVRDGVIGRNTIAFLPATVPSKSQSYIIVTAFLDGIGEMDGRVYPGADSNASGVAAMLGIAGRLTAAPVRSRNVIFIVLDGHRANSAGAAEIYSLLYSGGLADPVTGTPVRPSQISHVVNLDIIGSSLAPVVKYNKDYLIALGGAQYSNSLNRSNSSVGLHLTFDYYGSPDFTNLFYRKVGDQRIFLEKGLKCVVFTSGITMLTNKPSDTFDTLNYPILEKRILLISDWLSDRIR